MMHRIASRRRWLSFRLTAALLLVAMLGRSTNAQTISLKVDPAVRPASANRAALRPAAQAQSVRFARRPPQVGDQIEQTFAHEMQLTTRWRQGNEFVNTTSVSAKNIQRRVVSTVLVNEGRTQAVLVRYLEAASERSSSEQQAEGSPRTTSPVVGKKYRCQRDGDKLVITDELGNVPPMDELEIVNADMESVGRPSPLAEFLGGRTVAVGESISLPLELADRVLGLQDKFGVRDVPGQYRSGLDGFIPNAIVPERPAGRADRHLSRRANGTLRPNCDERVARQLQRQLSTHQHWQTLHDHRVHLS
jgi:hypothetical protein